MKNTSKEHELTKNTRVHVIPLMNLQPLVNIVNEKLYNTFVFNSLKCFEFLSIFITFSIITWILWNAFTFESESIGVYLPLTQIRYIQVKFSATYRF